MFEAAAIEFPFVEKLPKREKSRIQKAWDILQQIKSVPEEKGELVPYGLVVKILGLSSQRISQIIQDGRLESIDIDGHKFITEQSLIAFAKSERKSGRPPKLPQNAGQMWKIARDFAKGK